MAYPGFLNDNEYGAYPLLPDRVPVMTRSDSVSVELPTTALVDFRCVVGIDARWQPGADSVYLSAVRRLLDSSFRFEFAASPSGLAGYLLVFHRASTAPEFQATDADASLHGSSSTSSFGSSLGGDYWPGCPDGLLWSGNLTTGRLDDLAGLLAPGQSLTVADGLMPVEPALVQSVAGTYVRSVNLANLDRFRVTPVSNCGNTSGDQYTSRQVRLNWRCLTGDLKLKPGYNCLVRQNRVENSLMVAAAVGGGAGEPCGEVAISGKDHPPAGSVLLTGGPTCAEVVSSINGLSASVIRFEPGPGFAVFADPTRPHTLVVQAHLGDLRTCPTFVDSSH